MDISKESNCMKNSKKKVVKEDAIVGAEGVAPSSGDIQSSSGISTNDVLGKCDHGKNGFMSKDCFHVPVKVKTPLKRFEIANGGSKRKNNKKTAYEKSIKVIKDLFETDMKMFDKQKIMKQLSKIAITVKDQNDVKKVALQFNKNRNDIEKRFSSSKYAELKQLFLDFGKFSNDICAGKHKASWFTISMVIVALIYVLSPIDIVPDAIPVAGIIDDAFVLKLVYNAIKDEFNQWKANRI